MLPLCVSVIFGKSYLNSNEDGKWSNRPAACSPVLSSDKAKKLLKNPKKLRNQGIALEAKGAAKSGAIVGFVGGTVTGGIDNFGRYKRGEKTGCEAVLDTAISSTKCGAETATISAGAVIVKRQMTHQFFERLGRSSAPIFIAQTVLEMGKDSFRAIGGQITRQELLDRTGKNVVKNGTSWACAEAGAVLGTAICPVIGTFIGGVSGGIAGSFLGEHIVEKSPGVIKSQYHWLRTRLGYAHRQAA